MIWYTIHHTIPEDILVLGFGYSFVESEMEGSHIWMVYNPHFAEEELHHRNKAQIFKLD